MVKAGLKSNPSNLYIYSMEISTFEPISVVFSDSAAAKVRGLIEEEENTNLKLRVFVTGGGCSGFEYGLL